VDAHSPAAPSISRFQSGRYGRFCVCRDRRAPERYHSTPEILVAEIAWDFYASAG
jgi:hypothetical protein